MSTVRIYHNIALDRAGRHPGMLDGYVIGQPLVLVAQYDADEGRMVSDTLTKAYDLFNIGDDPAFGTPDPRAVAYRAAGNRSLSVGDVVQVGGRWFACARRGWEFTAAPEWFAPADIATYGSTGLEAARPARTSR